jgi:hypothetical protein
MSILHDFRKKEIQLRLDPGHPLLEVRHRREETAYLSVKGRVIDRFHDIAKAKHRGPH